MTDLQKLSDKKLAAVRAQRKARMDATSDAIMRNGLAYATHRDLINLSKGSSLLTKTQLALEYLNAQHDWRTINDEEDRRKEQRYQNRLRTDRLS
jgi:hypothetical protein